MNELAHRLQHRGTETADQLKVRLDNAQVELDEAADAGIWDLERVKVWV